MTLKAHKNHGFFSRVNGHLQATHAAGYPTNSLQRFNGISHESTNHVSKE